MASPRQSIELPKTMKAVVCHGIRDYRLEEMPVPEAGPGEVVIRVRDCGICASDIKCYGGAPLFWGDEHRKPYVAGPVIPGHEFTGEVVALGEGAADRHGVALGGRVVAEGTPAEVLRRAQSTSLEEVFITIARNGELASLGEDDVIEDSYAASTPVQCKIAYTDELHKKSSASIAFPGQASERRYQNRTSAETQAK